MSQPTPLVAVTGATGFIGTALCQRLLAAGFAVRALARSEARSRHLVAAGVEVVTGDLNDGASLLRLLADSDYLVHAAGAVRGNSQQDFDRVNVAGTAAVLQALDAQARPPRLLLVSSLAAREPRLSWYARSKAASEALVRERTPEGLILRPPAVYGPGDREMLPVFRAMARGFAPVPGQVEARLSLVHVSDLTQAIVACLRSPRTSGQTLTLCDGKQAGYSWLELAAAAEQVFGRRVRLWRVPGVLLDAIAGSNSALAAISGRAPMLTPPKLRELRHPDWVVDNDEITRLTGWTACVDLQTGLEELRVELR
ncbi:MAG: SDR family NAD(P)-dependent oxidoreductase [Halioglobus sp.]|nr:SDR family NAD(P)-dependent oxidoreductase [Halioglobus sp.]